MRGGLKKCIAAMFVALLLFALVGCEASIDVYEQSDEDNVYFEVDFVVNKGLDKTLEDGATSVYSDKKWTVERWLRAYFAAISDRDFSVLYGGKYQDKSSNSYVYYVTVPRNTQSKDLSDAVTLGGDLSVKTNLFLRTVSVERDDRFNAWLTAYEEAATRKAQGASDPADFHSMMGIVACGRVDVYANADEAQAEAEGLVWDEGRGAYIKHVCPSFFEAFPHAGDYKDLLLNNFWYASRKMKVACDRVVTVRDANNVEDTRGVYYLFSKYAKEGETQVSYRYYRADPTGWYIVAAAVGGLAIGIVILLAKLLDKQKNKPKKPQTKDLFPYDPFGEDGRIDPFA